MKKKVISLMMVCMLAVGLATGCGSKDAAQTSNTVSDQEAADKVAKLIDDIYVQERTDDTDAQCEEAKAAWDALTDAQKALVEGEEASPEYFGRDTGDASKDDPRNGDEIGENEILVLDLKGPVKASIKGLKKPLLDVLREKAPETHRKEGEKLKLTGEKVAHEGAFTPGNGWQEVRFTTPVKGRYFCLEALSPQANDNIAAIAEFDVLGADGKPVSREHWKIRYADSEETRSGNRTADKIFDLQESTFWMTVDNVAYPHQLVIDLSKVETVTGFRYLPRAEKNYPGMIKEYRVYVKPADFKY
mgnify:CR=1 FL=1